jgi:hypothetical protein
MNAALILRTTAVLALSVGALSVAAQTAAPNKTRAVRRAPPPPPVEVPLPPAPGEQLAAAALAHFGPYECEFNETVSVDINTRHDGYIDVKHRKSVWVMKPVLSHTGALRLEDVKGRMLMLQIANKSMLMDTQIGRRLVDNCVHEKQRNVAQPAASESLGIDPVKTAAAAAAAAAASAASAAEATVAANPGPATPTASR